MWTQTHRSASSSTRTSSSFTLTEFLPFPNRNSSTRPGVPMIISAPVDKNLSMSCAVVDWLEETSNNGGGYRGCPLWPRSFSNSSSLVSPDCGCEFRKRENTECICDANSLAPCENCSRNKLSDEVPSWADNHCSHFVPPQTRSSSNKAFQYRDNKR